MAKLPDEKIYVEMPFIDQLKGMGWDHIEGDTDVPYLTERESFRDVLLTGRLRKAIKKINLDDEGVPWVDEHRINQAVSRLERISTPKLLEANEDVKPQQKRRGSNRGKNWSLQFLILQS